jgi:hypothetical protein
MSPSHYSFVRQVIDALGSSDRDDVSVAFVEASRDDNLDDFAASSDGSAMLDRLYRELTTGYMGADEEKQAQRIIQAKSRRMSVETFRRGAEQAMIFPFRLPGLTVLNDAPISAEMLPNGRVRVKMPVRVLGTDEFRPETRTLPSEVFTSGLELPPDQVVGVRLYDEGGRVDFLPALSLVGFSGKTATTIFQKIGESAVIGGTLGLGGAAGGARAVTWGARALLWADRAAFGIFVLASLINEHRGWILKNFPNSGPSFLRAVDIANSAAAIYGMGRLAFEGYGIIVNLRNAWRAWREEAAAARLSASEQTTAQTIGQETENFLNSAEETRAALIRESSGTPGSPTSGEAPTPSSPAESGITSDISADLRSSAPQRVLVVGAESESEFAYASDLAMRGQQVTVVNPRTTEQAEAYIAQGGNFLKTKIELLPKDATFNLIREDYPYPLGQMFQPTTEFAEARLSRLAPGGRWVVVTESSEFAETLEGAVFGKGVSVTKYEIPLPYHEGMPQSTWPQEANRFIFIIQRNL